MKKSYIYFLSAVAASFIIGCGGGNSSSVSDSSYSYDTSSIFSFSKNVNYENYVVYAVDDPIIGATLKATNCESFEEKGNGEYILKNCVAKPTLIEIKDGIIQGKNVKQDFPILLDVAKTDKDDGFIITPLTTILATASDEEIDTLAKKLGVKREDLFSDKNEKVKKLLPKINSVIIASASGGAIANKINFLKTLKDEVINRVDEDGNLDVNTVLKEVKNKSLNNPEFFGIVIINENLDNEDPLDTLARLQNSQSVKFYGLVFDRPFEANITIKDLDDNKTFDGIEAKSDKNGSWTLLIDKDSDLYDTIINKDHLLQLSAVKDDNASIKLTSTITTKTLRNLINQSKLISATKEKNLIISNVTTAEDAILDKRGALNSTSYDGNLSELRVYYQDKVIKAAAIIKSVVDENASVNDTSVNDTYELVKNSISNANNADLEVNTSVVDYNTSSLEDNITNDTILSSQLNDTSTEKMKNSNKDKEDEFQTAAENAGYVFYRLLAYYKEGAPQTDENFVREYTKIIVFPSHYETQTCYLYGNVVNSDWNCDSAKIVENSSNFTLGYYEVAQNNEKITYSLDFNNSIYVEDLNRNYNYYGVIKSDIDLDTGKTEIEPMILVDSYDVVDAFRRMPDEDEDTFNDLKERVKNKSKKEVNYELNRWVKGFMDDVDNYFDDND